MKCSIIATGDSLLTQRLCRKDPQCLALKEIFEAHDIRFANFEMTVHDFEVAPSAESGGTWVVNRPTIIPDLKWLGFNMFAAANNHSLDWGHDGLLATIRHLEENECVFAGIGRNLAEASMPKYIDTPEGRVALISISSTGKSWHIAGEQRPDVLGRPGMNMLRFQMINYLPEKDIETLKEIVGKTYLNADRQLLEKEGFVKATPGFSVGTNRFEVGEAGTKTFCNPKDKERLLRYISEARRQADVVIVSLHVHEFKDLDRTKSPDFMVEFAHAAVDAGTDVFLAHGPHILRGIEIYKGKPIFHGLGNFFMQSNSVERQPADFYDIYDLGAENTPTDGFQKRSKNWTSGQVVNPKIYESAMMSFTVEDGAVHEIKIIPVTMGFNKQISRKGRPEIAAPEDAARILGYLSDMSRELGTEISVEGTTGRIVL